MQSYLLFMIELEVNGIHKFAYSELKFSKNMRLISISIPCNMKQLYLTQNK